MGSDGSCDSYSAAKPWYGKNGGQRDRPTSTPRVGGHFQRRAISEGLSLRGRPPPCFANLHVDVVRPELLLSSGNSVFSQAETKSRASFKGMRLRGIEPVLQGSQIPVGCGGGDGTRVDPFPWWGFEMSSPLSCSPCGAARLAGCAPTVLSAPLPGPEEETWLFQDFTHQSGRRLLDLQGTTKHIPSSAQRSQRPCETKPTVRRSSVAGPGARRCRPMHKKTKLLQALVTGGRRSSPGPAHGREGAT